MYLFPITSKFPFTFISVLKLLVEGCDIYLHRNISIVTIYLKQTKTFLSGVSRHAKVMSLSFSLFQFWVLELAFIFLFPALSINYLVVASGFLVFKLAERKKWPLHPLDDLSDIFQVIILTNFKRDNGEKNICLCCSYYRRQGGDPFFCNWVSPILEHFFYTSKSRNDFNTVRIAYRDKVLL